VDLALLVLVLLMVLELAAAVVQEVREQFLSP
jgi:hypothetical protein